MELTIEQWMAGEGVYDDLAAYQPMRLRVKGDELQTSNGYAIPVDKALAALPAIVKAIKAGERHPFSVGYDNGLVTLPVPEKVIPAQIIPAEPATVIVGCSKFSGEEVLRIAALLKVEEPATHFAPLETETKA